MIANFDNEPVLMRMIGVTFYFAFRLFGSTMDICLLEFQDNLQPNIEFTWI